MAWVDDVCHKYKVSLRGRAASSASNPAGHPARLTFGIDSAGNTCGQRNSWNGTDGPDLRNYKKLYYPDPLQLLDSSTFLGARSICVESCPGAESVCSLGSLPCRNTTQYR